MRPTITGSILLVAVTAMAALWAVAVLSPWHTATAAGTVTAVAIDADIDDSSAGLPNPAPDNTSTAVGAIDTCISVSAGDVFEIDVVMIGLPTGEKLAGANYDIDYDGAVVQLGNDDDLDGRFDEDTQVADGDEDSDGSSGEEGPDGGGTIGHDPSFVLSGPTDFSKGNGLDTAVWSDFNASFFKLSGFPTGPRDGVLNRVTVRAVGAGVSNLDLRSFYPDLSPNTPPDLLDNFANTYAIGNGSSGDAKIAVDQPCPLPTATPEPTPTPIPTATSTPAPCPPPANDLFSNAFVIPSLPFSDSTETTCATIQPGETTCVPTGSTVWYAFTPTSNTRVLADTFGSSYDTVLAAFTGTAINNLQPVGCNDDAGGTLQSRLRLDLAAGTTYYFQAGGFFGQQGNLVFSLELAPPPLAIDVKIDPIGAVVAKTGEVTVSGTTTCNKPAFVDLSGDLRQRAGRVIIQAHFSNFMACTGQTPWKATVVGENGIFKGGWADVSLSAFAFTTGEVASDQASASVQLKGSSPVSRECPRDGNFGFEAGLADTNVIPCWTVVDQAGSYGSWCNQTGTQLPQGPCAGNFIPVAAPPEGAQAAMTNQSFVGSHLLYRCGVLRSGSLSFKLYINNVADFFSSPPSLDYNTGSNQQFRADLVTAAGMAANPFTVAPSDVLLNLYQTKAGDPPVSGYAAVTANAGALVKKDVCLRFAVVDNLFYFHAGVDDVKIALR